MYYVCDQVREEQFLKSCFLTSENSKESNGLLQYVPDEFLLVKAIDSKNVTEWDDFEYLLSILIENRILKLYVELYLTPLINKQKDSALDELLLEEI